MAELMTADNYSEVRPAGHPQSRAYQGDAMDGEEEHAIQIDKLTAHISEQWTINKDDRVRLEQEMLLAQQTVDNI